ncbi:trypco2 family protein [Streptomyces sp. NPDC048057]|uniref:trypco2 family protein n=1 Tax=Streptomyces sp. NPDC048057 TaxID=3155628 RepID=UPI0033D28D8A
MTPLPRNDPPTPAPEDLRIDLADAVEAVRAQLVEAATRASGQAVQFETGDIEMEFTVELRRDTTGTGRVRAWVVEAGADTAHGTTRIHRVAFTLKPRDARTGDAWLVGNDDAADTGDFGGAPTTH